jgi:DnaJ-class molecular chaperone
LILLHHPDKQATAGEAPKDGIATPEALNVAYEILYDPERRSAYDAELQAMRGRSGSLHELCWH